MIKAMLQEPLGEKKVRCNVCVHRCLISPGKRGICQVRENQDGVLYSYADELISITSLDPVEKKPFYHVLPGSEAFSWAGYGCNMHCDWCQNHSISQSNQLKSVNSPISADEIVAGAMVVGAGLISATYTEPTVFFEVLFDVGQRTHDFNIINSWVTNGTITPEALQLAGKYLHAANVDLKGANDVLLKKHTGVNPSYVMSIIRLMKEMGIWVEVTTLVIPGLNDSTEDLETIAEFIADVDFQMPWHVSAYHPAFRHQAPPTSGATILKAIEIGQKKGLKYIYAGNIRTEKGNNTYCASCKTQLVSRRGYNIELKMDGGVCPTCGLSIPGIYNSQRLK
ncbi:AmmeMemoRadiSam system radical SAM enzyme [Myxococcota bacterium]|nr:AmmeMemoRadiSam system radical SAM enzyme [Myxococcota bacterium]MBU1379492.1 AmmeMemoRadiSam system radical SAM enzyme [Myxococcota bacterium]MBU1497911.1 AmmeMemoRadiSam system radical SAM enzyme [Myxococcota bacterium]